MVEITGETTDGMVGEMVGEMTGETTDGMVGEMTGEMTGETPGEMTIGAMQNMTETTGKVEEDSINY